MAPRKSWPSNTFEIDEYIYILTRRRAGVPPNSPADSHPGLGAVVYKPANWDVFFPFTYSRPDCVVQVSRSGRARLVSVSDIRPKVAFALSSAPVCLRRLHLRILIDTGTEYVGYGDHLIFYTMKKKEKKKDSRKKKKKKREKGKPVTVTGPLVGGFPALMALGPRRGRSRLVVARRGWSHRSRSPQWPGLRCMPSAG